MGPAQRNRLWLAAVVVGGVALAAALVLTALRENINAFYSPTQVSAGEVPAGRAFRLGGLVTAGSVRRDPHSLKVSFVLDDGAKQVAVDYEGILPDLFREGQGVVAQGRLGADGRFRASQVLAKHDENYMPPEVADALETAKKMGVVPSAPHAPGSR